MIGDGPQLKTLKEKYREAKFLGNKNHYQVAEYLGKSDVFVFPSLTDTFGVVLIEALSMGVPMHQWQLKYLIYFSSSFS